MSNATTRYWFFSVRATLRLNKVPPAPAPIGALSPGRRERKSMRHA